MRGRHQTTLPSPVFDSILHATQIPPKPNPISSSSRQSPKVMSNMFAIDGIAKHQAKPMSELIRLALAALAKSLTGIVADRLLAQTRMIGDFQQKTEVQKYFLNASDERRAQRIFEEVSDAIVRPLESFLASDIQTIDARTSSEEVINVIRMMIDDDKITSRTFFDNNFNPRRIRESIEGNKSKNVSASLSHKRETGLDKYRDSLDPVLHAIFDEALDVFLITTSEILIGIEPFQIEREKIVLKSLGNLSDGIDRILENLDFIRTTDDHSRNAANSRYELWYRYELAKSVTSLDMLGIDVPEPVRAIPLEVAYIALSINTMPGNNRGRSENIRANVLLDQCIQEGRSLVIRGEAGSGKTTLSKWLAYQLSVGRRTLSESISEDRNYDLTRYASGPGSRVPFLIQLRHTGSQLSIHSLVSRCAHIGKPPDDWIESSLNAGGVAIFDGIDEIAPSERGEVRRFVEYILDRFERTIVVITSRPRAVGIDWLNNQNVSHVFVNPLSDSDRYHLIDHWYIAVSVATRSEFRINTKKALELRNLLEKDRRLSTLAATPLLCAAVCALYYNSQGHLPRRLNSLCEALSAMLLDRRDREQKIPSSADSSTAKIAMDYERKKIIVADIADYMVRNRLSVVDLDRLRDVVRDTFSTFYGDQFDDIFVDFLIDRSGLLREESFGGIDFIHNTFRDYLAAIRLVARRDFGFLVQLAADRDWQNVVLFACGSVDKAGVEEMLTPLLEQLSRDRSQDENGNALSEHRSDELFILKCAVAALELPVSLQGQITAMLTEFLPPRSIEEAHVVAEFGDENASELCYDSNNNTQIQVACIRALGMMRTERSSEILRSYLEDSASTIRSEILRYVNPLELEDLRIMVLSGSPLPQEYASNVTTLLPLFGASDTKMLNLSRCYISDISMLPQLINLEDLVLSRTPILEFGSLSFCHSLKRLDLSFTKFDDGSIIEDLVELEELILDYTDIKDVSFARNLRNLKYLGVKRTVIPFSDIVDLPFTVGIE